jgi:L-alanine-DL-glutamate epimerase-like enolase superfamily enzyme
MNRRRFLQSAALGSAGVLARAQGVRDMSDEIVEYGKPVFDLHKFSSTPIRIASIELLQAGKIYLMRTRSTDGAEGIIQCKDIADYIPILAHRVIPHFLNQDARDLEHLVDEVYATNSNYKLAGQEFWCPVAYIEQSLFDLMGKTLKKPASELMGGAIRKEIPVYLSGSARELPADDEVGIYIRGVEYTGAKAVKFKIGGRMSDNHDATPGRTDRILELAHEKLASRGHYADGGREWVLRREECDCDGETAAGDEVSVFRRAVPVGGAERNEEGGGCAGNESGVRGAEFQPVAIPVDCG